ncbi:MAG: GreA/GreB family elongation factor [Verrucomicrobia bacterium]|nr:GreA/GreB family elongation factor [Verrucomicrobiota bacterium]MDE3099708.1 GreA/GreB family elongation factor [Verrucomicrobiota bacterium]
MREEFEKLAAAGKIEARHIGPLTQLAESGCCQHRSWGFGKIRSVDTVFARFTIDFPGKAGHTMDLGFAAESLKAIPKDHIVARKANDLEGVRRLAAHHLDLIKLVLNSFGGKATADQVQQTLTPEVIPDDWKKWWETARREMKKDGHFIVPGKKTEPIVYQAQETSLEERLLTDFRKARGLKARVAVAGEILKMADDLTNKGAVANEAVSALNSEIASHQRTQPAVALEAVFVREDLRAAAGLAPAAEEITEAQVWLQENVKPGPLLDQLPSARHARALESFKAAHPERWHEILIGSINVVPARLVREMAGLLVREGRLELLKDAVARLISQHGAGSELLLWFGRERNEDFVDILGPEVFRAMLTAMERDQFNEKRSNRLRDFIMEDQELLGELTASADIEVIKDLTRALQLSTVFDDMDKRSLLARLVKAHPAVQSLVSGEQTRQDATWLVSWESLERRRAEYQELVQKKIPANSREIAIARSYGDLRENHEYKAAKEMQKVLMRRKDELENQLARARGSDFSNVRTDIAGIGTIVEATDLGGGQRETFTILGAWDSDPERGVISYLSPIGAALLNRKVGDEVEFDLHGGKHRHRIEKIGAVRQARSGADAPAAPQPSSAASPAPEPEPAAEPPTAPVSNS